MIDAPRLILIGACGRNSGKTVLAKKLIARFAAVEPVYALKVTSVEALGAQCPRHSHEGCGACSIFTDYCLTEETDAVSSKDTSQMLAAGAKAVWWLRSLRQSLGESFVVFREKIPPGALVIAESNSLRLAVKPALFIMAGGEETAAKKSALAVMRYADITLPFRRADTAFEEIARQAAARVQL
ncbi:MAG: hypothetical protein LBG74_08255 [Spirochaetaceae bacterium]|jgi:hypothetical protein|nr:hypothetical protein [Spirochaetaceae bacterium]